jgi:hypothetical protein
MCVLRIVFMPVEADYKGITDRYIKSFTKITVYCGKSDHCSVYQVVYQNHCLLWYILSGLSVEIL